jgi:hypothetical protein
MLASQRKERGARGILVDFPVQSFRLFFSQVFFSIKGIYYQADVMGETVTWIVPHKYGHQVRIFVSFS